MEKVVLATGNKKKVEELNALLADLNYAVVPQSEFNVESVPETGTTFRYQDDYQRPDETENLRQQTNRGWNPNQ